LVVQLADDEKLYSRQLTREEMEHYTRENTRDLVACGLDPTRTFIFRNTERRRSSEAYQEVAQKLTTQKVFGFDDQVSLAQYEIPLYQIAASAEAFPELLDPKA
jgi:tryptophanyl-tRNA synthetase